MLHTCASYTVIHCHHKGLLIKVRLHKFASVGLGGPLNDISRDCKCVWWGGGGGVGKGSGAPLDLGQGPYPDISRDCKCM